MGRHARRRQVNGLFDDISKKAKAKYQELAPKAKEAARRAGEAVRDVASKAKAIESEFIEAVEFADDAKKYADKRDRKSCVQANQDVKMAFAAMMLGNDKFNQFSERNPRLVQLREKAADAVDAASKEIENKCIIGGSSLSGAHRRRR